MKHPGYSRIPLIMMMIVIMAGACQSGKKASPVLIEDLDEIDAVVGIESFHQIYHLYPSPGEMLGVIDMADMTFNKALLNPVARMDQYHDSKAKTLVLGIYMT